MSAKVFRQYKIFAIILFLCAFGLGAILGSIGWNKKTVQETTESTIVPILTTETRVPLSYEERLYQQYHELSKDKVYETYTLRDLDGNGVPEMLIERYDSLHEIVPLSMGKSSHC